MSDTIINEGRSIICNISGTQTVTGKLGVGVEYVNNVMQYATENDFPTLGNPDLLYIAKDANSLFRYDRASEKYYRLGGGLENVKCIDGGTANG